MIVKTKQQPLSKNKLSPLFLLGKVRKNSQISNQRQSALAIIERQQYKINNRYGEIVGRYGVKTEGNQVFQKGKSEHEIIQNQQSMSSSSNKISQILKKSFNRGRFNSVDRKKNRNSSPYLSQERKASFKTELNRNADVSNCVGNGELVNKSRQKIAESKQIIEPQMLKRKLSKEIGDKKKIFVHFGNVFKIDEIVENKRYQKQIIGCIKKYILEEQGDSSQIENLYQQAKTKQEVKQILFLEKVLIILIVDLIINRKLRLTQMFIKIAIKTVIRFYQTVFKDLISENLIDINTAGLPVEAFKILQKEEEEKANVSFNYILHCIEAKLRTCFKYCRELQKFYKSHHKSISQLSINMSYFKLLEFYSQNLLGQNWASWSIQFLQVCPSPYLHYDANKKYTLVLDLDQTLIHYKVGNSTNNYQGEFLIRPFMFQFLEEMSQHYQLGIFTCSMPEYADVIINHMKPISFRLYRHHTIRLQGEYVKDLSRLGRNLKTLILVDNLEQNFKLQKLNGIHIRSWYGDRNDDMLKKLGTQLKKLALLEAEDLRQVQFQRKFL